MTKLTFRHRQRSPLRNGFGGTMNSFSYLVVLGVSSRAKIFQVRSQDHFSKVHEVAVGVVFNLKQKDEYFTFEEIDWNFTSREEGLTCTVPQGYCLARTILFPTLISSIDPTTANGKRLFIFALSAETDWSSKFILGKEAKRKCSTINDKGINKETSNV